MVYDVAIIGAGICGCALAYELAKYKLSVLLLEKENDVSLGTTKANSAIVHAGYDPLPGTKMAYYNVRGNQRIQELCKKLDVPYKQIGSLVVAFSHEDMQTIDELYRRGMCNGVRLLQKLDQAQVRAMEPNISDEVMGALYAPTAAVIYPWELAIALAETAVRNGAVLKLSSEVTGIQKQEDIFCISTSGGTYRARFTVNAAGVYADRISGMVAQPEFTIRPSKGEYFLLDTTQGSFTNHILFQCPTKAGKGVLVSPTASGNLIVGPNTADSEPEDVTTTGEGLAFVCALACKSTPGLAFDQSIRNFAGVRAISDRDDFIIGELQSVKGFFQIAGIKSPGLTCAPAIAVDMVKLLEQAGLELTDKESIVDTRKVVRFRELSTQQKIRLIGEDPRYGKVVCRCMTVTEGEIIDALNSPIPVCSVDGVKRRAGAGMGRCQGGFCGARVHQIIADALGIPPEQVLLDREGSTIITG